MSASIAGQFVGTDSGYAFRSGVGMDSSFSDWWWVSGDWVTDGPLFFSPIWFHPDGYRSVVLTDQPPNALFLLEIDPAFRTRRASMLGSLAAGRFVSGMVAPLNARRRRLDLCVIYSAARPELLSIDNRELIQRAMPAGVVRCVDALESGDDTLFVVETEAGTYRVVRATATDVAWVSSETRDSCRLAIGIAGVPSLWCVSGRRIWLSRMEDFSAVDFEMLGPSDWELLGVPVEVPQTVVVHELGSSRVWLVGASGQRWSVESFGDADRVFYGRVAADKVAVGSRLADAGLALNLVCW